MVSKAAAVRVTRTVNEVSVQAPAASSGRSIVVCPTVLRKEFADSKTSAVLRPVAAVVPVLQTRAPTGNVSGPVVPGLLLSRPSTFQVVGRTVSTGAAEAGAAVSTVQDRVLAVRATSAVKALPRPGTGAA